VKKVIARIKLNPGQGGYFDPITRIHLTHGDPERDVYAGMNTEGLKQAVRNKRISLISGSLGEFIPPFKLVKQADGKVVLVPNTQTKTKQQKTDIKPLKSVPVKEEQSVDDIKVTVKSEPAPVVDKIQDVITVPEKVTVEPVTEPAPVQEFVNIKEDSAEQSDSKSFNSPFKKNKKKNAGKKDNEEQKSE